jgi:hypothetical protein
MAGDIPQFHRGRSGKATSQNMNAMGRAALHARHDHETAPTPFGRDTPTGPGLWPIVAVLGEPVIEGKSVVGFKWNEAHFDGGEFIPLGPGRGYNEEEKNFCVPLGISPTEYGTLDLAGATVKISYMNSKTGQVLYFEPPSAGGGVVDFLKITAVHAGDTGGIPPLTPNCSGFADNRRYEVDIVSAGTEFFTSPAFEFSTPSFGSTPNTFSQVFAYNLLEYRNGDLGGEQEVNDCDILQRLATVPVGTLVLGKMIAQWEEPKKGGGSGDGSDEDDEEVVYSRAYAFSVVNDTCIQCCLDDGSGLYSTTFERAAAKNQRRIQPRSPISVMDEMLR